MLPLPKIHTLRNISNEWQNSKRRCILRWIKEDDVRMCQTSVQWTDASGVIVLWCNRPLVLLLHLQLQRRSSTRTLLFHHPMFWTFAGRTDTMMKALRTRMRRRLIMHISDLFMTISIECGWHGLDLKFNDRAQHHSLWHCCRHWKRSYSSSAFAQSIRGFYIDCWIDNCINKKATPAKLNKQTLLSSREANQTTSRICRPKCKVFEKHTHNIT